jgi:hypothetical protein
MKKLCLVLHLSWVASAGAGNPPSPGPSQISKPAPAPQIGQTNTIAQTDQKSKTRIELFPQKMPLTVERVAANEMTRGGIELDGSLVELAKTDNPLQLINPAAPERYGSEEDNVVRDSVSGNASGLKFLELRF